MPDKREHTNHPYLDNHEVDNRKDLVLWNTNALFPVRNLIETDSERPVKSEPRVKVKEKTADTQKSKQLQPYAGMDALSPFAQWLMSLRPSSLHGQMDEHIDTIGSLPGLAEQGALEPGKKKKKKKKKKKEARHKGADAHSELPVLDTDIVSDTLAELIANQGHIEEAIAMYRKLVTHHPEKTAHYIQRISELRQGKT